MRIPLIISRDFYDIVRLFKALVSFISQLSLYEYDASRIRALV